MTATDPTTIEHGEARFVLRRDDAGTVHVSGRRGDDACYDTIDARASRERRCRVAFGIAARIVDGFEQDVVGHTLLDAIEAVHPNSPPTRGMSG